MASPWSGSFLRARVARRILGLFLVCAMLPLLAIAILGYRHVAGNLEDAARSRLREQSKSAGLMLFDRLSSLAGVLEGMADAAEPGRDLPRPRHTTGQALSAPSFRALVLVYADGRQQAVEGDSPPLPTLLPGQPAHLDAGGTALVTQPDPRGVRVFLVRKVPRIPGAQLWGWVEAASVWGSDPGRSVAPAGTPLCLTTTTGEVLTCPGAEAASRQLSSSGQREEQWTVDGDRYLAGQWNMFLKRAYLAPSWIVGLGVSEREVFAPLIALRRTFLLGLLLALATVFALSHIQLRRNMAPLEALLAGTRRIAAGDFSEAVEVRSGDEFEDLAAAFNQMEADLQRRFRIGSAVQEIGQIALEGRGLDPVLGALFARSQDLARTDRLSVALAKPDDQFWWTLTTSADHLAGRAPRDLSPQSWELEELQGRADGFVVRRGETARSYFDAPGTIVQEETVVLPMLRNRVVVGAILLRGAPADIGGEVPTTEAMQHAEQIKLALSNTQLVEQLDTLSWGALTALARTIDAVSPWTAGHSERVTLGAIEIGRRLGLPEAELNLLHRGGLLHDLGKVGVPAQLLDKPGKLTDEEYTLVKSHTTLGAKILAPIGAFRAVLPLVLHHHEMLDGSGYPHGLSGDQIPLSVRIMTVADVFDALVSDRPYRAAWSLEKTIAHLREGAGTRFDPRVVEALAAAIDAGWRSTTAGRRMLDRPGSEPTARLSLWPGAAEVVHH